ncbi:hypothetical protein [Flavobacterium granuli]|uniref:Uncharacterized protein n=1 Tax=Flavobacterium granuli TaxID=280093 RepID=A0A1M5R1L4_9FLAO|nr:hypothetical protein [Flavobacterium granuli]PRZ21565.1 hypothetical protein BC624_1083 [Flavobacterium granuli]SHH19859.1 hypothetical protein SAMN05443373_1093 [Flavobacterium granuli]
MKKALLRILLIIFLVIGTTYSQTSDLESLSSNTTDSKVDFFKNQKDLVCWIGELSNGLYSQNRRRSIFNLPIMSYNDDSVGQCRIVCYPKNRKQWELIIKSSKDTFKTVRQISLDLAEQKKYDIYGFFVSKNDLMHVEDYNSQNTKAPKLPCFFTVYKKVNAKWVFLKKVKIDSDSEVSGLWYNTVVNGAK